MTTEPSAAPPLRARLSDVPLPALVLGLGGLIPFLAGAVAVWLFEPMAARVAQDMQVAYATVILSFLGAVHWGAALSRPDGARSWGWMGWSVTPALLAWFSVMMAPESALMALMACYLAAFAVDMQAVKKGLLPLLYLSLRRVLTTGAFLCLGATLLRLG
ncbi:DUF3429 domain-containing protein [Oceanibaculum sp.]|uniref:DUF3429 domain-containing protein n=1 Tax=Oceanibaculum sp. TaxID=1903597 RepID=UPI00258881D4|nr:DUF3429 domain-containing protein [Oceanibaculum sp.]MCH2393269.1 DUF3429 domain-containing protein [Oceanibaculum sp.]